VKRPSANKHRQLLPEQGQKVGRDTKEGPIWQKGWTHLWYVLRAQLLLQLQRLSFNTRPVLAQGPAFTHTPHVWQRLLQTHASSGALRTTGTRTEDRCQRTKYTRGPTSLVENQSNLHQDGCKGWQRLLHRCVGLCCRIGIDIFRPGAQPIFRRYVLVET